MQRTTLTSAEIKKIFRFVQSKAVTYKDVQFEIVDHLASSIECRMESNEDMRFEEALKETYQGFHPTGFTDFVEGKSNAMGNYWKNRFWDYLVKFFTLPKILLTALICLLIFSALTVFGTQAFATILIGMGGMGLLLIVYLCYQNYMRDNEIRDYLVIKSYNKVLSIVVVGLYYTSFLFIEFLDWNFDLPNALSLKLMLSLFFGIYIIIAYATLFVFPKMLKKEVDQNYAHLNLA